MSEQPVKQPDVSNFEVFFTEGQRECVEGKYGKAAESFGKALDADPTDEQCNDALYHWAYAGLAEGKSHLARQDLTTLLEFEDSDRVNKLKQLISPTIDTDKTE